MLMTFRLRPRIAMPSSVPTTLMGIATNTTIVAPMLRSVTSSTAPASKAPKSRLRLALVTASSM